MKKSINRILSLVVTVCIVAAMMSVCVVANAYDVKTDIQLSVTADAQSIANDGTVNVSVAVDNYSDYISGNKVLAAAVVNISYDSNLVTPDIDSIAVDSGISGSVEAGANDGMLTFIFTGDSTKYITAEQLSSNGGVVFTVSFTANGVDGDADFSVAAGEDTASTSLAVLDLDVMNGAEGYLITSAGICGIGDYTTVQVGEGASYVYEPKRITVTMVDVNGTSGRWYAPDSDGPFYVGDRVVFNTAYAKINLDVENYEPWTAYFTLTGGTGSGNSAGNIQLYVGAGGGAITLDKAGTWQLTCSSNGTTYTLMTMDVYPTPTQEDVEAAAAFDLVAEQLPEAENVTLDDEAEILSAYESYESLSAAAQTFVTKYDKYISTYEAYLTLKYGSVGRAKAYSVISIIAELPEPSDIALTDAEDLDFVRTKYNQLNDDYKQFVDNYKKLLACESALDAIYVPKTITYVPGDTSATSTSYMTFSSTEFYVSDSLKNNTWWQNYTFNYTDTSGTTHSGKIYNAVYTCASANISQRAQVGFGKSTGASESPYTLTVAGEWIIYGEIEDSTNGNITIELARFTVEPTPYGNDDNAAAEDVSARIEALPEQIMLSDVETVEQLKVDYDALVRYDLISSANVAKLEAAVLAAERAAKMTCDVNRDGVIDSTDLLMIELMIIGQSDIVEGADVDGDGRLTALDLLKLEQHFLGYSLLF